MLTGRKVYSVESPRRYLWLPIVAVTLAAALIAFAFTHGIDYDRWDWLDWAVVLALPLGLFGLGFILATLFEYGRVWLHIPVHHRWQRLLQR